MAHFSFILIWGNGDNNLDTYVLFERKKKKKTRKEIANFPGPKENLSVSVYWYLCIVLYIIIQYITVIRICIYPSR